MHADHLKLMFPMGWTLSTMAWGIIDGKEMLKKQQFDGASNLKWAVGTLEYGLEFLLDCYFENGEFVAQVRQPQRLSASHAGQDKCTDSSVRSSVLKGTIRPDLQTSDVRNACRWETRKQTIATFSARSWMT